MNDGNRPSTRPRAACRRRVGRIVAFACGCAALTAGVCILWRFLPALLGGRYPEIPSESSVFRYLRWLENPFVVSQTIGEAEAGLPPRKRPKRRPPPVPAICLPRSAEAGCPDDPRTFDLFVPLLGADPWFFPAATQLVGRLAPVGMPCPKSPGRPVWRSGSGVWTLLQYQPSWFRGCMDFGGDGPDALLEDSPTREDLEEAKEWLVHPERTRIEEDGSPVLARTILAYNPLVFHVPADSPVTNLTAQSSGVVTLYAVWEPLVVAAPTVTPGDGTVFTENSCTVTITCATDGADIYYNIGSAPRATSRYLYSGPFTITDTSEIYTFARKEGINSEPVTKVTITKRTLGLAEAAGAPELTFTTGGDANWTPVGDTTSASGLSAQSGTIGDESETWMQTTVTGAGTFAFNWKVDCEEDYIAHNAGWDHLAVATNMANGTWAEVARIDGASGWLSRTIAFADAGTHTIRWTFVKDADQEDVFADRAWVSGVTWTPEEIVVVDPLPEIESDSDVTNVLAGAADETRLKAHISSKAQYDLFRAWVDAKGLNHQTVKSSSRAWFSYAIGANGLVEKTFQESDVVICSPTPISDGGLSFEVSVGGALIGAGATQANLESVFRVQGAYSLRENAFSSKNVVSEISASASGSIAVTVRPKHAAGVFFARVCLYADGEPGPEPDE